MTSRSFKFLSPGIFLNEIDNSQLTNFPAGIGPVVIGRTSYGPGLRPTVVESFDDYAAAYGLPNPGVGGGDQWRDGNSSGPTYAAYAAQAYLRANGPVTMIRLLGEESPSASTEGKAGWVTRKPSTSESALLTSTGGGAYGLFICNSSSAGSEVHGTGSLAAVFYCGQGVPMLKGKIAGTSTVTSSAGVFVDSTDKQEFTIRIISGSNPDTTAELGETFVCNFTPSSKKFIRKVFNTNPSLTNGVTNDPSVAKTYWLGETFENDVLTTCDEGTQIGIILALNASGSTAPTAEQADFRMPNLEAKTPWVVSQHQGAPTDFVGEFSSQEVEKLFRLVSIKGGEWPSKNLKVSITNIKASRNVFDSYGTFDLLVRKSNDTDMNIQVVERFSGLSLNPKSPTFVSKRIGDQYLKWDETNGNYRIIGNNPNLSNYFRVEVSSRLLAGGLNKDLIPFGFYGAPKHKAFSIIGGSGRGTAPYNPARPDDYLDSSYVDGRLGLPFVEDTDTNGHFVNILDEQIASDDGTFNASFGFPEIPLRLDTKHVSTSRPENVYFGIDLEVTGTTLYNHGYADLTRPAARNIGTNEDKTEIDSDGLLIYSYWFTLDNVSASSQTAPYHAVYVSGSRQGGLSLTADPLYGIVELLDRGHNKFTMPVLGGHDGLNVLEREPFGQHVLSETATEENNYAYYTINRALTSVDDKEMVEMNILCAPGVVNPRLTKKMIDICETRGDAIAVIDIEDDYIPATDSRLPEADRIYSVKDAVASLDARGINSSFGCAYYPWVQIADAFSGDSVWVPPSTIALGVLGSSEARSELWFAPAGFTRGGLTNGAAGLNTLSARQRLTSKDRDVLYESNINPIASFPSEGLVIFGQKTLQVTPSALDRINVRRLMIFIKREISLFARDILFDQNVQSTWQRFLSRVNPFLTSVKLRFGLTDFLVVLDETTTTPDLIDRNIMYAKVFVKPARSIEFIAVDFMITNTGAEFL
jgi:hypothetical protein